MKYLDKKVFIKDLEFLWMQIHFKTNATGTLLCINPHIATHYMHKQPVVLYIIDLDTWIVRVATTLVIAI